MTNTTYFEPYRDEESVGSSFSEVSRQVDSTEEEERRASSSLYLTVRKAFRAWISLRQRSELQGIPKVTTIFSYAKLKTATENFSTRNKIGEGGFGPVFKGTLSDGREIAVKRLSLPTSRGKAQFLAEIAIINAVQHRNLIKLYGHCIKGDDRLLVYEYLKNKSLDQALFGNGTLHLDWTKRYKICLGIAKGLAYLHEDSTQRVVHRDVKSSNILLDIDLNPKISDFGLAQLYDHDDINGLNIITTSIAGTRGYLAPEYAMHGHLTEKVDVYGFGVVALEILCGRENISLNRNGRTTHLLEFASSLYESNRGLELMDPTLTTFNHEQAMRMLGVALRCTQASPSMRPSMSRVVVMLTGDSEMPSFSNDWKFTSMNFCMSEDGTSRSSTFQLPSSQTMSASSAYMGDGADLSSQSILRNIDELLEVNNMTIFSYAELRTATGDFSLVNKLGEGEFGAIYKGTLDDEREVAIKRFVRTSYQEKSQFEVEISVFSAVQHSNIVKMYGYCVEQENMLLVYEYLKNKSLDQALFGNKGLHLDWKTRYNICLGTARALAYFHDESNPRIIHRDVKTSNILLDNDMNPKISNLCLAKLHDETKTHVSTRVGGTVGYIAPEYAMHGHLTEKADVFGFGVVALEILCGRPVIDPSLNPKMIYLLELVWRMYEDNRSLEMVDQTLTSFNEEEAMRVLGVALLCTQASPKLRPSMSQVVAMLTRDSEVTFVSEKPSYLIDWLFNDTNSYTEGCGN